MLSLTEKEIAVIIISSRCVAQLDFLLHAPFVRYRFQGQGFRTLMV